jgi:hypothetical protein
LGRAKHPFQKVHGYFIPHRRIKADNILSVPGAGSHRVIVTEHHRFYRASTTYFEAGKTHSRRTASVGPGFPDYDHDDSWEELHNSFRQHTLNTDHEGEGNLASNDGVSNHRRRVRNSSVDASHYHSQPVAYHEEQLPNVPPYSPPYSPLYAPSPSYSASSYLPSPVPTPYSLTRNPSPAQSSEDFRNVLSRNTDALQDRYFPSKLAIRTRPPAPLTESIIIRYQWKSPDVFLPVCPLSPPSFTSAEHGWCIRSNSPTH